MSKFVTYVIRLPEDQEATREIVNGVRALVEKNGGEVTAASNEDEIRAQAKELGAKAAH